MIMNIHSENIPYGRPVNFIKSRTSLSNLIKVTHIHTPYKSNQMFQEPSANSKKYNILTAIENKKYK